MVSRSSGKQSSVSPSPVTTWACPVASPRARMSRPLRSRGASISSAGISASVIGTSSTSSCRYICALPTLDRAQRIEEGKGCRYAAGSAEGEGVGARGGFQEGDLESPLPDLVVLAHELVHPAVPEHP